MMMAKAIRTAREADSGTALRNVCPRQDRAEEEIKKGKRIRQNRKGRMTSRTRRGRGLGEHRTREESRRGQTRRGDDTGAQGE